MSKEKPLAIRSILSACLSSWAHSPRTLVLLIFIIMLGISEADFAITNFTNQQLQLSSGDVLYYHLAKGFNTIMSSAMFLIMADELPRKISFQNSQIKTQALLSCGLPILDHNLTLMYADQRFKF